MLARTEAKKKKKIEHVDKIFAKKICRIIYYMGLGDCWYEPSQRSSVVQIAYVIWSIVSNFFLTAVIASELLSNFLSDLTIKEKNEAMLFSFAHPPILFKFVVVFLRRNSIKLFFKTLIEDTRVSLTVETEALAVRKSKIFIAVLCGSMVGCLICGSIDSFKYHYETGLPFRTLVTVYPTNQDLDTKANLTRFVIQIFWWYLVSIMSVSDSLCLTALIYLGFKFRTLKLYFDSLKNIFKDNLGKKSRKEMQEEYIRALIVGVNLHRKTMTCASNLRNTLGSIYSAQILQSIALLSTCLIKLVRLEHSFTFMLANGAFIMCVGILTGTYMIAAGDVTYEAAQVPTSIFHSGWEQYIDGGALTPFLVLTLRRSQEPVIMTAFGIVGLSYGTFISILRSSYSFFAVMY